MTYVEPMAFEQLNNWNKRIVEVARNLHIAVGLLKAHYNVSQLGRDNFPPEEYLESIINLRTPSPNDETKYAIYVELGNLMFHLSMELDMITPAFSSDPPLSKSLELMQEFLETAFAIKNALGGEFSQGMIDQLSEEALRYFYLAGEERDRVKTKLNGCLDNIFDYNL